MGKRYKTIKWFVYLAGTVITITVFCIIAGVLLEEIWGINTLYGFYAIVARMSVASMILGIPCCIGGVYMVKKNREALGGKR